MMLWLIMALMTAGAIFSVLWPLSRRAPLRSGSDVAVYRDQLEEIERDRANCLIGEHEAAAARVEVSRRLIAAADVAVPAPDSHPLWRRRAVALAALLLLPLGAGALYLTLGSPSLDRSPLASREEAPADQRSIAELIDRVEAHLEQNPEDGRGWEVIGPVYLRLGRFDEAVKAQQNVLRLLGQNAERWADLGEALAGANNGVVTAEARQAFLRALSLDPADFRARYFSGLAAEQDGRPQDAADAWRKLLASAPPDAGWIGLVRESLARVDPSAPPPPGPSADDIAAASKLAPEQQAEMVRGMVARLAERLKQDGSDIEGWQRLLRAYMVLGDKDKALTAADDARRALASDPDKLRRVDDMVRAIARVDPSAPPPPGPSADDIAAASKLAPEQQAEMVRGMVARLAERLKQDGSDVEGWLRLLRAYMVLGDKDQARAAAGEARRALGGDADKLRRVDELIKGLGLEG